VRLVLGRSLEHSTGCHLVSEPAGTESTPVVAALPKTVERRGFQPRRQHRKETTKTRAKRASYAQPHPQHVLFPAAQYQSPQRLAQAIFASPPPSS
jgi:hypothetical protein